MYQYFISFSHMTKGKIGYGNTVVEANVRITDFDTLDEQQKWIHDVQKWIENQNGTIKNVIVLNFQLLN